MVVNMTQGAIATSGNYEVFFDQERLYHHIINPDTGRSPKTDVSTSVKAGSAAVADAFSTACFVLKPSQAMALIKSRPGLEALILTRYQQKLISPGFEA
jgi:thiamine biosynthesis lipoprotein